MADTKKTNAHGETVKRLAPTNETLRALFLHSGNLCAFPECSRLMMNAAGDFVGQICHIEAADVGGERFNENNTNEHNRKSENLMLMCYEHHVVTNDVNVFDVPRLRQMKSDHEKRFSSPDRAIRETLKDWTDIDQPSRVQNLLRLARVLNWGHSAEELEEECNVLNAFLAELQKVPQVTRNFVGLVAKRMHKLRDNRAVAQRMYGTVILASDVAKALQLEPAMMREFVAEIDGYKIGDSDEIDSDVGVRPAIRLRNVGPDWAFWLDLAEFCEKESVDMAVFTHDLEFSRLDD